MTASALAALLALAAPAAAGTKLAGAGVALNRNSSQSGGSVQSGGGVKLHGSVGETARAPLGGTSARFDGGYVPLASQPGTITAITAVSKGTGTLELAWTAPGRDGLVGDVVNGFYRIDTSSDPGHVFNTAQYQLEIPTTVVAGSAQSILLGGLEPNTTYYTRIYLADSRRFYAEDSKRSDESTLANRPVNPAITARSSSSVTIGWTLPAGGSAGFDLQGSTADLSALLPAGAIVSSRTSAGVQVSLTLQGLAANTTYFFRVASLNWQGEPSYATVLATVTIQSSSPFPVQNLARAFDSLRRTVNVTWTVPPYNDPLGVLVLLSTSPAAAAGDGSQYLVGQALSDGAVVKSTSLASGLRDSGLALNTTYFYHLFTENASFAYSIGVSTSVFLDLPPMAPTALTATPSVDRRQLALSWRGVVSSSDGTPFFSSATPKHFELAGYEVFRATSVFDPFWVSIGTVAPGVTGFLDTVPDPNASYAYKVESLDTYGPRDAAMVVDTQRNVFVVAADEVTRLQIPAELLPELSAANNALGTDVVIRAVDQAPDAPSGVFKAVDFGAFTSPGNRRLDEFAFSKPSLKVVLKYAVAGGEVVPSGVPPAAMASAGFQPVANDPKNLGMYWFNGAKFVKLFGKVDAAAQTVAVDTSRPGRYEIRTLARPGSFHFDVSQLSNKAITPNGDGSNDTAVLVFDNPRDSTVTGEVYDLRGGFVSYMTAGPVRNSLQWDGKAGGRAVPGGIYVYVIKAEGKVFSGTVVVVQ